MRLLDQIKGFMGDAGSAATSGALDAATEKPIQIELQIKKETRQFIGEAMLGVGVFVVLMVGVFVANKKGII